MTQMIILVVIVLAIIAVAQLVRLYEMSRGIDKRREEDIPVRDNKLNANLMLVFMFAFYGFFLWLCLKYGWTGRGESASYEGVKTDELLNLNFVIVIIAALLTNTLLFVFAWKYVAKPGQKAYFFSHSNKIEIIWTLVPAVILTVIIFLGIVQWNAITDRAPKEARVIELYSEQFKWTARYAGGDNELGKFDYKLTTADNSLGLVTTATIDSALRLMEFGSRDSSTLGIQLLENKLNDPKNIFIAEEQLKMENDLRRKQRMIRLLYQMKARHDRKLDSKAFDDVILGDTLYLENHKLYEFNFRAKDVIHSAYFPHFRAQMNAVPGMTTRFKFKPRFSSKEMKVRMNNNKFNYVLMCNKICGGAHYKMKMIVVVLDAKEHKTWMASNKTFKTVYFKEDAVAEKPAAMPGAPVEKADSTKVAKL